MALVLASASPQRRDLLIAAGYDFTTLTSGSPEVEQGDPELVALANATAKAEAVAAGLADSEVVLAADTVVSRDGRLFGKPRDRDEAEEMLASLSSGAHLVHTGVAVAHAGGTRSGADATEVIFKELSAAGIAAHVALGEWEGRAGGYAIQESGADLVASVNGRIDTVIGLPMALVAELLPEGVQPQSRH